MVSYRWAEVPPAHSIILHYGPGNAFCSTEILSSPPFFSTSYFYLCSFGSIARFSLCLICIRSAHWWPPPGPWPSRRAADSGGFFDGNWLCVCVCGGGGKGGDIKWANSKRTHSPLSILHCWNLKSRPQIMGIGFSGKTSHISEWPDLLNQGRKSQVSGGLWLEAGGQKNLVSWAKCIGGCLNWQRFGWFSGQKQLILAQCCCVRFSCPEQTFCPLCCLLSPSVDYWSTLRELFCQAS